MTPVPKPEKKPRTHRARIKRGERPAKVRKTPRGKLKKACDTALSVWVKYRDRFTCQVCGWACPPDKWEEGWARKAWQNAHGFRRYYMSTRWDPRNCFTLCNKCHTKYSYDEIRWTRWLKARWGEPMYYEMEALSLEPCPKVDYEALLAEILGGEGHYAR